MNALPVTDAIKRFRPTAIVCTHFLPAQLLASLLLRGVIDARTAVVTTDYDFQGLWLTGAFHALFLAREEGRVELMALGLPPDRVAVTGIPIAAPPAPAPARDATKRPMLLISAGATGGDYALSVVRQTLHMRSSFTATVLCGRNNELRQRIEQLVAPAGDRYRVLGFTAEMPQLLQRADLFVGKPGGLSSSECMAAGLPMALVNTIPGQEVRNGDYLMEQGAAVRCNTPATIGWKIDEVLREPGRLQRMQAAARRTGRPEAAADVLTGLLDGPSRPLVVTRAAQKTILAESEQRLVASDLPDPPRWSAWSTWLRGAQSRCFGPRSWVILRSGTPPRTGVWCCGTAKRSRRSGGRSGGCSAPFCGGTTSCPSASRGPRRPLPSFPRGRRNTAPSELRAGRPSGTASSSGGPGRLGKLSAPAPADRLCWAAGRAQPPAWG
nr:glycosyltransferase [Arthrobacter nitrophenolicus]